MRTLFVSAVVWILLPAAAYAGQTPAPAKPQAEAPATPAAQPPTAGKQPEGYSYSPEGRRDPFVSPIGVGADAKMTGRHGEGVAGLSLNEISVRGILQSQGTLVAMVEGPDKKTYVVHAGDKFLDGTIKSINPQGLVVIQEVNDPLSLVKQREVRKLLRSLEDAKE